MEPEFMTSFRHYDQPMTSFSKAGHGRIVVSDQCVAGGYDQHDQLLLLRFYIEERG
jgi:hypothetical protein